MGAVKASWNALIAQRLRELAPLYQAQMTLTEGMELKGGTLSQVSKDEIAKLQNLPQDWKTAEPILHQFATCKGCGRVMPFEVLQRRAEPILTDMADSAPLSAPTFVQANATAWLLVDDPVTDFGSMLEVALQPVPWLGEDTSRNVSLSKIIILLGRIS
jgi:hypothetical protein